MTDRRSDLDAPRGVAMVLGTVLHSSGKPLCLSKGVCISSPLIMGGTTIARAQTSFHAL